MNQLRPFSLSPKTKSLYWYALKADLHLVCCQPHLPSLYLGSARLTLLFIPEVV